jgi:Glucosamine 6-phosphate synthetase, contains amidotransferase and phosphosugar isomerase domains
LEAVFKAEERLKGAYALAIVSENNPDEIVAVRNESPLILGEGENETIVASDIPAVLKYTKKSCLLRK